jgi:hypothetical protein
MIGIATQTYDLDGARVFRKANRDIELRNRTGARRVSRTATLDGGCVISDMGFSDADRDFTVQEQAPSVEAVDFARYITETYSRVTVAAADGSYEAVPGSYEIDIDGNLIMKMLIVSRLSE